MSRSDTPEGTDSETRDQNGAERHGTTGQVPCNGRRLAERLRGACARRVCAEFLRAFPSVGSSISDREEQSGARRRPSRRTLTRARPPSRVVHSDYADLFNSSSGRRERKKSRIIGEILQLVLLDIFTQFYFICLCKISFLFFLLKIAIYMKKQKTKVSP